MLFAWHWTVAKCVHLERKRIAMCLKKKCPSDVTLVKEERCRVLENGVLWRIFGRERA